MEDREEHVKHVDGRLKYYHVDDAHKVEALCINSEKNQL